MSEPSAAAQLVLAKFADSVRGLAEAVNDALRGSIEALAPSRKVELLLAAREGLRDLQAANAEHCFALGTSLTDAEAEIDRLTIEYAKAGWFGCYWSEQRK